MIGTQILHYRIEAKLGEGGMGTVYLAENTHLHQRVALKFLPPHFSQDPEFRVRLEREAVAAASLSHPNIVTVHDLHEHEGQPFIAMEYLEGSTLSAWCVEQDPSIDEILDVAIQIGEGLKKAHEADIVHRDLKPSNIIVDRDGRPKILDFGLAKLKGATKVTKSGSTLGTASYMSPEQSQGQKVDHRTDLWSLGVILYEMIARRLPFDAEHEAAIAYAIAHEEPEPLARYKADVSDELQRSVAKCLAKDLNERYQSAADFVADLRSIRRGELASGVSASTRKRNRWVTASAAIAALGMTFFVADRVEWAGPTDGTDWTNSVAVLVFRDLSPGKDQDYFCEGVTDEITGRLSTIKQLKVTSMQSMLRFKGTDRDLKEIGKELNVEHILEGSVLKDRDSIRVRVQLIRVEDDAHIWSDRYDREVTSIFAVHDEISLAITNVLKIQLSGEEVTTLVRKGTDNIDAHNSCMQGRYFLRKRTTDGIQAALTHFKRAIASDPEFALAWSGLADAWVLLPLYSLETIPGSLDSARNAAQTAVRLDSTLAEAHASMGLVYYHHESDVANSVAELEKSIELNPNYVWSHVWYGRLMGSSMRRKDVKIEQLRLALELDPLNIVALNLLANVLSDSGLYAEAETYYLKSIEVVPEHVIFRVHLAKHYKRSGQYDKLVAQYEKAIEIDPDLFDMYRYYASALLEIDRQDDAIEVFERLIAAYPDSADAFFSYGRFLYQSVSLWAHVPRAPEEALAKFKRAVEIDPKHADALTTMAYVYADVDDFENAMRSANRAIEISPNNLNYVDTRGDVFYEFGYLDSAITDYRRFLEKRPNEMVTLRELADAATFARDYNLADSAYEALAAHYSQDDRMWGQFTRSRPLRHQGRFRETLEMTKECMNIIRTEVDESDHLGALYYHRAVLHATYLGSFEEALADLDTLEQLASSTSRKAWAEGMLASVRVMRPWICARQGNFERADFWLRQWDTANVPVPNANYWLAVIEMERGHHSEAVRYMEKIDDRDNTDLRLFRGVAYLGNGQFKKAVEDLEYSVARYHDDFKGAFPEQDVWARYKLAQAYEADGQTERAIEQYETFLHIWRNADEGLKSVEDARARLARLKSEVG